MLQTIINSFSTFFSRAFWFGSFLPVLVVGFLHALLAALAFQPSWLTLDAVLTLGTENSAKVLLLFALMVLAGYVLAPFVPLLRGLLDGSLLPRWLYRALRAGRRAGWRAATEALDEVKNRTANADRLRGGIRGLSDLRQAAEGRIPADAAATALADQAISSAEAAVGRLTLAFWFGTSSLGRAMTSWPAIESQTGFKRWWWRRVQRTSEDLDLFQAAAAALGEAFALHTAESALAGARSASAVRLDLAHTRYIMLVQERAEAERIIFETEARRHPDLDLLAWQATRFGDVRRTIELYSKDRYGAEYDWIWPRLALVLPEEDTGLSKRLVDTNAQLNFAILLIALFQTVPLVWLPLLYLSGGPLWLLLLVGWLAPIVNLWLYELAVQSQSLFGGVVATAIDRHRWELLTKLHQALPPTLTAERDIWERLRRAGEPGFGSELVYERPVSA